MINNKNPKIVDIKSIIIEHPKNSCKLLKTIKQAKKVSSGKNPTILYIEQKGKKNFLNEKIVKITEWSHGYRDYMSIYNVEILNSFNPELQLKDTEFTVKNKLI